MQIEIKNKKNNRSVLIIGLFLLLSGALFLTHNFSQTINTPLLGSSLVTIIGGIFLVITLKQKKGSHHLFMGTVVFLYGIYFCIVFSNAFFQTFTFPKTWPLLSLVAGIALITAGLRQFRKPKFVYLIPAISFVVLSVILLLFSTGLVALSLKKIILRWMPLLMIFAGVLMILISMYNNSRKNEKRS
ncbi:MAG: hypothetical protein Ta2B_23420 [Termitinemataceae bacterium]|nr:MAG: hypothetical protein Ta2B_23420 [Termitinemataceae bacterium]